MHPTPRILVPRRRAEHWRGIGAAKPKAEVAADILATVRA
jgi:hypothetical protein